MTKYELSFKRDVLRKLALLKEKGIINIEGVQIRNVRDLASFMKYLHIPYTTGERNIKKI